MIWKTAKLLKVFSLGINLKLSPMSRIAMSATAKLNRKKLVEVLILLVLKIFYCQYNNLLELKVFIPERSSTQRGCYPVC